MVEGAIREAASAICVRDGGTGDPEVLVVERSPESRFLPGYVAFPGGAVEPGDDALAERWFGSADEGHRAAALRELIEEVGLAVTSGGVVTGLGMTPIDEFPPERETIPEVCHWVAPPEVPVRFDARYFAVSVDPGVEPVVDGREVVSAWWTSPRALLSGWTGSAHKLYWPTWFTVSELAACSSREEVLALRFETREPNSDEQESMPRHVMEHES
ncbi:MAG: NUDIX domain-containing protein [Actinomycetota bacterium]|nr:NUDIX domain-containing protein [Actinomycetota bacterium]